MNSSFQDMMRHATRLTRAGRLGDATAAIQQALGNAAGGHAPPGSVPGVSERDPTPAERPFVVLDDCAFEVIHHDADAPAGAGAVGVGVDRFQYRQGPGGGSDPRPADGPGTFASGSHTHRSLTRGYKLYIPPGATGRSLPLVVMLHGCTQDPDDFAAGTGMNALGQEEGFYVLYPEQAQDANPMRCWNWFKHNHQVRDRGESGVIADLTRRVIDEHRIAPDRVYIAGMSAGGAMATAIAAAYPDLFAAVGVHSGLPPRAARSMPEGLAAMRTGAVAQPLGGVNLPGHPGERAPSDLPVCAIVFHGDQDQTVHPCNGEQVVAAVLRSHLAAAGTCSVVERGVSAEGRPFTRSTYRSSAGTAIVEHWVLHGAGHNWAGGHAAGSHTDPNGPDASREMVRFFLDRHTPSRR